jgi:hypothetical protein
MQPALIGALAAMVVPQAAQDSVLGTAGNGLGRDSIDFTFDAHSGPSGESPGGTVTVRLLGGSGTPIEVSCLSVSGNRAAIIAKVPPNLAIAGFEIAVEDVGPAGQDKLQWNVLYSLPATCPVPTGVLPAAERGDVVVVDAPPVPTSMDQCKNGGWRRFGFRNQGACVSFVSRPAR